jgi:hypothetical protein
VFFFEKKEPKNFCSLAYAANAPWAANANWQKFFASFFSKKKFLLFWSCFDEHHNHLAHVTQRRRGRRRGVDVGHQHERDFGECDGDIAGQHRAAIAGDEF